MISPPSSSHVLTVPHPPGQPFLAARQAMATRFEIVLHGSDPVRLQAAAEEAFDEVQRIERVFSFYHPASQIYRINHHAAEGPVRVELEVFDLLVRSAELTEVTDGLFDITIGPLIQCWGFAHSHGQMPEPEAVQGARELTGWNLIELNSRERTVKFLKPGVMLNMGAIGKGYALEQAADLLRNLGVTTALLHGGSSTVSAIGAPPGEDGWKIAIENPFVTPASANGATPSQAKPLRAQPVFDVVKLRDQALSVSTPTGRFFKADDQLFGHVIDPKTGWPVRGGVTSAVVGASATDADAISTALLAGGEQSMKAIHSARPDLSTLLVTAPSDPEQDFRLLRSP